MSLSTPRGAALITGSARRLGRAMALALADWGYDIALHYHRSEAEIQQLQAEITAKGRRAELWQADLSDLEQACGMIEQVAAQFPHFNLLIHNASLYEAKTFLDVTRADLTRDFNLHLYAPWMMTQDFARVVDRGQVIVMTDAALQRPNLTHASYHVSKSSLWEMMRVAALDLAPKIRVNALAPGSLLPLAGGSREKFEAYSRSLPLQRAGGPNDLIHALKYLLESDYITGECLSIDGGQSLI